MKTNDLLKLLLIALFVIVDVGFISCGNDDSKDEEKVDLSQDYLNRLYGSWELISRTINGESENLSNYKQVRTYKRDMTCHIDTYDLRIITSQTKPTESFDLPFKVYKEKTTGEYILYYGYRRNSIFSTESFYYIKFDNNYKILYQNDRDRGSFVINSKYKKI